MSQINRYPSLNQPIEGIIGNDGIVIPPFFDGIRWDVFIIGAGHIFTTGNIALGTLTINLDGGIAELYPTDAGVANPIGGILNIFGGSNINTAAPAVPGNSVIVNLDNNVHISGSFIADIDITSATGDIVATLGQVNAGTTMTAGTGITATTGNIVASAGNITATLGNISATAGSLNAGTTVTAGTGITSTTGNIVASAGNITATLGNISATAGSLNAGTTVTAGTGITSTTGNITATAGNVVITAGNLTLPNTNVGGTQGEITFGGNRFVTNYGANNTFVGQSSGNTAVTLTGFQNSSFGSSSGQGLTSGFRNCLFGFEGGQLITTGSDNIALGVKALGNVTTGTDNLAIGTNAGLAYIGASSNICLSNMGLIGDNNTIRIGTQGAGPGQQNVAYFAGIRAVSQATTDAGIVTISSDHQLGSLGSATNGQLAIGSTGTNPVLGTLTAGTGIDITNGAGSITVNSVGGGFTWTVETVNLTAVAGHGYMANKAGRLDIALPAASAIGDTFKVLNIGLTAIGWRITQGAGQQIWIGDASSSGGAGGYIEATAVGDSIELVCFAANNSWMNVSAPQGNITIA